MAVSCVTCQDPAVHVDERVVLVEVGKALQILPKVEAHDIRDFRVAVAGASINSQECWAAA